MFVLYGAVRYGSQGYLKYDVFHLLPIDYFNVDNQASLVTDLQPLIFLKFREQFLYILKEVVPFELSEEHLVIDVKNIDCSWFEINHIQF